MKAGKIILVIAVIVIVYFTIRWWSNRGIKAVSGGTAPTAADKECAAGNAAEKIIVGSCTKPMYVTGVLGVNEKCFSSEQLNLNEGEEGWSEVADANGFGKKWYFNYQSGDRFCYVDKKILAPTAAI